MTAGRRIRPRALWVPVSLLVLALTAMLTVVGLSQHRVGAAGTPQAAARTAALAPGAGPVLLPAATHPRPGQVALTFDDGPDPQWTPRILDVLAATGTHATFFVLGSRTAEHPDLVRRMVAEGHEVGVHSYTHAPLATAPPWRTRLELALTQAAVVGATGERTRLFRPPYSATPDAVSTRDWPTVRLAGDQGYVVVLSTLDTRDWTRPGLDAIVRNATPSGPEGAVVLLHDGGGDRAQTVEALPGLIAAIRASGHDLVTVSAATGLTGVHPPTTWSERVSGRAVIGTVGISTTVTHLMGLLVAAFLALTLLRALLLVLFAHRHARHRRHAARAPGRPPPVSVVVPAFDEAAGIAATVRSVVASDHPDVEVVVVDDGSTDGTADLVERLGLPGVRVLRQPNRGKPAALDAGIAAARHDVLVLVDGDTVLAPDALRLLCQPFGDPTTGPEVGAVSGNTKVGSRGRLLGRWQHIEYVVGFNLDRRMFDVLDCIPTVPGAIGAFRREALAQVGGVSADTLAEDTDLTMALGRAGWRVTYEESAVAWTEAPATLRALWQQRFRWCYGTLQAMWKHRHAVVERGRAGHLGRRGLPYLLLFQVAMPLLGPVVDIMALYGLVFLDPAAVVAAAAAFTALQLALGAYAFRLDGEPLGPLWALPLQQFVYRQLVYAVVIQSVVTAVSGVPVGWQRMRRQGESTSPAGSGVLAA